MAYGYGLGATPAPTQSAALPLPAAPAPATPSGGHWQGDLWIADTPASTGTSGGSVTISSGSSGLPPAPAGYQWDGGNPPRLVQQTTQVTNAAGETTTVTLAPPLQQDANGWQYDSKTGELVAGNKADGSPVGSAYGIPGPKTTSGAPLDENGKPVAGIKTYYGDGSYSTSNDHGTLDLTHQDGTVRPGASAPPTKNADGSYTPAATNAGDQPGSFDVDTVVDVATGNIPGLLGVPGAGIPGDAIQNWSDGQGPIEGLGNAVLGDPVVDEIVGAAPTAIDAFGNAVGGLLGGGGSGPPVAPLVRDPNNYIYGRDPNYVANTQARVLGAGQDQAAWMNAIGNDLRGQTDANGQAIVAQGNQTAAGMQPYAQGAAGAGNTANAALGGLEATEGPSAAQAQLDLATQQGIAIQQAQARSGRGFGQSAQANSVAAGNAAQITQQAGLQAAMLRAQENAAWRQRNAANIAAGGQLAIQGNSTGGQLYGQGQAAQAGALNTNAGLNLEAAKTQGDLSNKGYASGLAGEQQADTTMAHQADLGLAQEQGNTAVYAADRGQAIADANNKAQTNAAIIGALGTGAAVLLSDEREKTDIHPAHGVADQLAEGARGYSYRYLDPRTPGAAPGQQTGPMAQRLERQPALRGVVSTGADGRERVDPGRLSLVTASALSEVVDRLNHLESRGYRFGGS